MYTRPRPGVRGPASSRGDSRRWTCALGSLGAALAVLLAASDADACRRCDDFDFLCCDVPANGIFFLTSFSGEGMACGGQADGDWYYSTSWVRWHCGARLEVRNRDSGDCVVVEVADAGPADWVEENAGGPILDASPLVCRDLFGSNSCGWSDHFAVEVVEVPEDTPLGPDGCGPPLPEHDASFVGVSAPPEMVSGERAEAWIEMRNEGRTTWDLEGTQLATTGPRDHASALYDPENWTSSSRASGPDHSTYGTGETGRFTFMITAPEVAETTTIRETFGLVQGADGWFGPEDAAAIEIVVHPLDDGGGDPDPGGDGDADADPGGDGDADADPRPGPGGGDGDGDADGNPGFDGPESATGGYSGGTTGCSTVGASGSPLALLAVALAVLRRRPRQ